LCDILATLPVLFPDARVARGKNSNDGSLRHCVPYIWQVLSFNLLSHYIASFNYDVLSRETACKKTILDQEWLVQFNAVHQ
jgi:hypothetical protein